MLYVIILCIMLCCGCLFVELIDRRKGVLAERRARTVKEGKERCFCFRISCLLCASFLLHITRVAGLFLERVGFI